MGSLDDFVITGRSVLEDIQRQIKDKAAILMQHSEEVERLKTEKKTLQEALQALPGAVESKKKEIVALDIALAAKQAALEADKAPMLASIVAKENQLKIESAGLDGLRSRLDKDILDYTKKILDLEAEKKSFVSDKAHIQAMKGEMAARQIEIDKHAKKIVDETMKAEKAQLNLIIESGLLKAREKAVEELAAKANDSLRLASEKEAGYKAWADRNSAAEQALAKRTEALKTEEAVVSALRLSAQSDKAAAEGARKNLETYQRDLDAKAKELKYTEQRYKQLALEKGIAEELKKMGG